MVGSSTTAVGRAEVIAEIRSLDRDMYLHRWDGQIDGRKDRRGSLCSVWKRSFVSPWLPNLSENEDVFGIRE